MRFCSAILALIPTASAYLPTANPFLTSKSAHCAEELLADGCAALGQSGTTISTSALERELGLLPETRQALLESAGISGDEFSCATLCSGVATAYERWLPATVDTGCRHMGSAIMCDVDLSEDATSAKFTEQDGAEPPKEDKDKLPANRGEDDERDIKNAAMSILRAFRSFPYADVEVTLDEDAEDASEPTVAVEEETSLEIAAKEKAPHQTGAFLQLHSGATTGAWSVACVMDEKFRESSGMCHSSMTHDAVFLQLKGKRAEGELVNERGCPALCKEVAPLSNSEHCAACGGPEGPARLEGPSFVQRTHAGGWREEVARVNLKAQAYVNRVVRYVDRHYDSELTEWFGNDGRRNAANRYKVKSVLRSLQGMMDNVDYVYPGPGCKSNTYAYVYPNSRYNTFNDRGQFKFFLCDVYMRVGLGEKIETLTHEGSHHRTSYTDDVQHPERGVTAYGRSTCQSLARRHNDLALKNADNYCYFINDAAERSR